jgi:tetratricopeptide (TPR) repeat protein
LARLQPGSDGNLGNLAVALHRKGNLDEAIGVYREAAGLLPRDAHVRRNLGIALQAKGRLDEAESAYEEAVELDRGYADAHYALGTLLQERGRHREAIVSLRDALRIAPGLLDARFSLGLAHHAIGAHDEAIEEFRACLAAAPAYAEVHFNLGKALHAVSRYRDALASFQRSGELAPQRTQWRSLLTNWKRRAEVLVPREDALDRHLAAGAMPFSASALIELAPVLAGRAEFPMAAAWYEAALRLDPGLGARRGGDVLVAAAAAAVRAGCSSATGDAARIEAAAWLRTARAWLEQRLELVRKDEESGGSDSSYVRRAMRSLSEDSRFMPVRDGAAMEGIPREERAAWAGFWSEVTSMLE